MWHEQHTALSDMCHLITPDLRGFGEFVPHDLTVGQTPDLDLMVDDVAACLDRFGLHRVVLGGLSMGGYIAMGFARKYPERLAGLLLADTKATRDPEPARENRERIARTVLHENSPRVLLEETLPNLLGRTTRSQRPAVQRTVRSMVEQAHPVGVARAQRAMAARPDYQDTLKNVSVPTLVVTGEEDTLSPPEEGRALSELVPHAELRTLPGAGHLSAIETPGEFNMAVRRWLRELIAARI